MSCTPPIRSIQKLVCSCCKDMKQGEEGGAPAKEITDFEVKEITDVEAAEDMDRQ